MEHSKSKDGSESPWHMYVNLNKQASVCQAASWWGTCARIYMTPPLSATRVGSLPALPRAFAQVIR
jgi:hypothetical protein